MSCIYGHFSLMTLKEIAQLQCPSNSPGLTHIILILHPLIELAHTVILTICRIFMWNVYTASGTLLPMKTQMPSHLKELKNYLNLQMLSSCFHIHFTNLFWECSVSFFYHFLSILSLSQTSCDMNFLYSSPEIALLNDTNDFLNTETNGFLWLFSLCSYFK